MTTVTDVVNHWAADNGLTETPMGSNHIKYNDWYYGSHVAAAWCATCCSNHFFDTGCPLPATTSKGFAYTPAGAAWFKNRGAWVGQYGPIKPGYVVFFYWPNLGRIGHVGLVARVYGDGTFDSWEGNTDAAGGRTGGKVMLKRRSRATVGAGGGFGIPPLVDSGPLPPQPPPTPAPPAADKNTYVNFAALPGVARGARGQVVRVVQGLMVSHCGAGGTTRDGQWNFVDGQFGSGTAGVLADWQRRTGQLAANGICDDDDWRWLTGSPIPMIGQGAKGQYVRNLQGLLIAHGNKVLVDGDFGAGTKAALADWQRRTGHLEADGIAGPATFHWLIGA
jgi:peptidoglycan hydrolase-like protein with peptidoglycan-binding domain